MNNSAFLLLAVTTFLGGILPFLLRKKSNDTVLKLLLSFGGSFLFSVTILYLIPEVFSVADPMCGVFVLLGFFFQIILEQFTAGVEHGHMHLHHGKNERLMKIQVFVSLSLHSFMEGIPLGTGMFENATTRQTFLSGIILHELPAAFALSSIMYAGKKLNPKILLLILLYAIMAPSGAILSKLLSTELLTHEQAFRYIMAFIVGTFLHISTIILFENSPNHQFSRYKIISVICGAVLASLSLLV